MTDTKEQPTKTSCATTRRKVKIDKLSTPYVLLAMLNVLRVKRKQSVHELNAALGFSGKRRSEKVEVCLAEAHEAGWVYVEGYRRPVRRGRWLPEWSLSVDDQGRVEPFLCQDVDYATHRAAVLAAEKVPSRAKTLVERHQVLEAGLAFLRAGMPIGEATRRAKVKSHRITMLVSLWAEESGRSVESLYKDLKEACLQEAKKSKEARLRKKKARVML